MDIKFLSVKEFAEAAGKSQQAIYKRINNANDELQPFIKIIDGKAHISSMALNVIYKISLENAEPLTEPKEEESSTDKIIEILREQIEAQRKDIEEKNNLINTLATQLENSQKLISQEQQLNYANTQKILALEAAAEEREAAAASMPTEEKKKKSIFSLFRKRESA